MLNQVKGVLALALGCALGTGLIYQVLIGRVFIVPMHVCTCLTCGKPFLFIEAGCAGLLVLSGLRGLTGRDFGGIEI